MKNYIKYFYDIAPNYVNKEDSDYIFTYNNYNYRLLNYTQDLDNLNIVYELIRQLNNMGIYCHLILLNKEKKIYSVIDNKNYVLLASKQGLDKKIELNDILSFNIQGINFKTTDWKKLWELKTDYFEYQINQFGYKYPKLRESFSYYSGYVELAISLLNRIPSYDASYLAHKRIKKDSTLYDFYNPFNLIVDNKVRDVAEYFKTKIFDDDFLNNIKESFIIMNFNSDDYLLFFIRMLYPTFYFDEFEKIVNNDLSDNEISKILNNTDKYENNIKKLYKFMLTITNMPIIEWLME